MSIRKDIRELDYITEQIVRYERENDIEMGDAFQDYEEALEWLYDAMEEGPEYMDDHSEHQEFFQLLMRTGLHRADEKKDLWKLEKRLDEYSSQGYDETELVIRYRLEAEELGKTPSARDARDSDHMPTEYSYSNSFDDWANARWRAGFEGHERLGPDLLLEKLKDYIHSENEDRPIEEYEIPSASGVNDAEEAPTTRALRDSDEIGGYPGALEQLGFHQLREDGDTGRWRVEEGTDELEEEQDD